LSRGDTLAEITLIRHAPARSEGRLCGRRDVPCELPEEAELRAVARAAGDAAQLVSSPARRCRETAAAMWPAREFTTDPRLWEQDFGTWEGLPLGNVPDLGPLSPSALAAHRPPGGESFEDVVARVAPALDAISGRAVLVAHAGVIRAALAKAVGAPATLAFLIDPLSVTRLRRHDDRVWSVERCNWRPL